MKFAALICIILAIWCVYYFTIEKVFRWLARKQKEDSIKQILFEKSDYFIIHTLSGKEYLIVKGRFYRL